MSAPVVAEAAAEGAAAARAPSPGLAVLGPELVRLMRAVDDVLSGWARAWGASEVLYPELVPVSDLDRIDFFQNFPHLAVCTAPMNPATIEPRVVRGGSGRTEVESALLANGKYVLQSAACYNVYFDLGGRTLDGSRLVTTLGTCFRNEKHYVGLERMLSFHMREIVCVGASDAVIEHLTRCKAAFERFTGRLGLDLHVDIATDPFFEQDSSRAKMQRLFPTKQEFLFERRLAVASLNAHRNFFGDRCGIRLASGGAAFSGCFGVGLERMCTALVTRHGDAAAAVAAVREAERALPMVDDENAGRER